MKLKEKNPAHAPRAPSLGLQNMTFQYPSKVLECKMRCHV